jgi:hypothetical protein
MAEHDRRGHSLICTEARAHAAARAVVDGSRLGCGGRAARARSRGRTGRSRAGYGYARSPGSVELCLTGPGDGPTDLSP